MRAYLFEASMLGPIQPTTIINNPPSNVTTWNNPQSPPSNIIVPAGQSLVINALVEMGAGTHIYVESGAALQVNSTITGACGEMWQGVIVAGNNTLSQTAANQGFVAINTKGVIEHAVCGIKVQGLLLNGFPSPYKGGGIVFVGGGKFKNCTTGVEYHSYLKQANKGKFFNAEFTVDQNYRGGNEKIKFLKLESTYGVFVSNGLFKDERTANCNGRNDRATGIQALDAGFIVSNGSRFESLDFGVKASTLNLNAGIFSISGNVFTDCFTGIYATLADGFLITGNTFNLNRPDVCDNLTAVIISGIQVDGFASNILIAHNTINNTSGDNTEFTIGTECNGLGVKNNEVLNNGFNYVDVGNRAVGQNGHSSSEGMIYSGLLYECNSHEISLEGDFQVLNGEIRRVQGEEIVIAQSITSIAAGNIFSGVNFGFQNNGAGIIYYYGNGSNEDPGDPPYSTGLTKIKADEDQSNCGVQENCPNPPCTVAFLNPVKTQFLQNKQLWISKLQAFPAILNAAQKLVAGKEISQLRLDMDRDGRRILQNYQLDTVSIQLDSILTWLDNLETYESDYHLARHYFFTGNFAVADTLFAQLPARYGLSGERLDIHNTILEVLDVVRPQVVVEGSLDSLPTNMLTLVQDFGDRCDEAGALARQLSARNGIELTVDCLNPAARPATITSIDQDKTMGAKGLIVFPNPVSETLHVVLKNEAIAKIRLLDVTGRISIQSDFLQDIHDYSISVKGINSGVYVL